MRRSRKRLPWRRRPVEIPGPLPRRLHRDESGSCRAPKLGVYFDRSTECMNVTGVEWRDLDPHEGKFSSKHPPRRAPKPVDPDEDDVVEIHGPADEETADGLDEFEWPAATYRQR